MKLPIAILFIVGLVVGFADVGRADSEESSSTYLDIQKCIKNDDYEGVFQILKKIKTGQIELKPIALISLLSGIFNSAISKLYEGKGVDDTLLASLYAILLFGREVVGYLGGIVHGVLQGTLKGLGGGLNGLVSGLGDGLESGNLIEGLLEGVAQSLAGGADKGSNGLGFGFASTLNAVIN